MKAQLWKISVSDGVMGAIHGMFSEIIEIHVPSLNITCNLYCNSANFFRSEDRYVRSNVNRNDDDPFKTPDPVMVKEIEFPDHLANRIDLMLEYRDVASRTFTEFFNSLPEVIEYEKKKSDDFKEDQKAYSIKMQERSQNKSPDNVELQFEQYVDKELYKDLTFWCRMRERISGVGRRIYRYLLLISEKK